MTNTRKLLLGQVNWFTRCGTILDGIELNVTVHAIKRYPNDSDHQEDEYTPLRTHCTAGEPSWSLKGRVQQMPRHHGAAIGHRKQKRLTPIEGRMKPYREPQISCSPQRQAEEESYQPGGYFSEPRFPGIALVSETEHQRQ